MSLVEFELYRPIKADTARVETDKSGEEGSAVSVVMCVNVWNVSMCA